jgi:hypothetical protein
MKKSTITKKVNTPHELSGKYVISRFNFGKTRAWVLGIPLKVVSEIYVDREGCVLFDAVSCITGHKYQIPYDPDLMEFFNTYTDVLEKCGGLIEKGYSIYADPTPEIAKQVVMKDYNPIDNSWAKDQEGNQFYVAGKKCQIKDLPFTDKNDWDNDTEFILVKRNDDGKIGRCMFMEHCL